METPQSEATTEPKADKADSRSVSDLQAKLLAMEKKAEKAIAENFKYRENKRKQEEADKVKKGEFESLYNDRGVELESSKKLLEENESQIQKYKNLMDSTLAKKLEHLPPEKRASIDLVLSKIPNVEDRIEAIDSLLPDMHSYTSTQAASIPGKPVSPGSVNPDMEVLDQLMRTGTPEERVDAARKRRVMRGAFD